MVLKFEYKEWFAFISILLIIDLTMVLDIPFLRQIFGFLFLTILPGLLILQILKLDKIGLTEKFVLSVGLSVSFLMFFGLLINNLSLNLGYETPLATVPLLILFNLAFIVLAIIGYKIKTFEKNFIKTPNLGEVGSIGLKNCLLNINLSTSEKTFLIFPILFPALSIFGMHVMNITDNNILLMLLLLLIPIYVAFVCFFNQKFPKRFYPVVIFLIGVSLLLLMPLRSNHIIGVDAHLEYYFFRTTLDNLYWSVLGHSTLNACLSISLLPTIYQSILDMNTEFLFRILYSSIFSIVPLTIYVLSRNYVGDSYAFLASCFSMFQSYFLVIAFNPRTSVAVLFFALAMMSLFNGEINSLKKSILFIVFMASCMVSHYSTTYIFFFIMFGAFIGTEIVSKKYTFKRMLSVTIVILFFSMIFLWYSQVTEAAFYSGVVFIEETLINLNQFFIEESRSSGISSLAGGGSAQKGIPYKIEFVFTWMTFVFIGIGVITLIRRYKEMLFTEQNFKKPEFLKKKFEIEYLMIALACVGMLVILIALPYISVGYDMMRSYAVTTVVLSVFFVIGGIMVSRIFNQLIAVFRGKASNKNTSQVWSYLTILLVLIPYFLCVADVTYNMAGVPRSILLNSEGELYDMHYLHDQESYSAKWLKEHGERKSKIYADHYGRIRLVSQGKFSYYLIKPLPTIKRIDKGYIYLRYYNVVNGEFQSEYSHRFVGKSEIYDNGGSKIYRG